MLPIRFSNFPLTILLFIVLACDSKTDKSEGTSDNEKPKTIAPTTLSYENLTKEKKNKPCINDECTRVKIEYPSFKAIKTNHKKLNEAVNEQIERILADHVIEVSGAKGLDQLMSQFVKGYQDFKKEFPEAEASWYVNLKVTPSFESDNFTTIKYESEAYTGGAHAITTTEYVNYSPKGRPINKLSYFFTDQKKLKELAEQKFRAKNKLNAKESLNDAGFMFDDDQFTLSENYGFANAALVFYYNSYEIAPYSEGPIELQIPMAELKGIYKF